MDAKRALLAPVGEDAILAGVNGHLAAAGVSITREDASMLAGRHAKSLAETERVEFGTPAVVAIAEAAGSSPSLSQGNVAVTLAELQNAFYVARDELPIDVPDAEIVEALLACLNELGDATEVAEVPTDELMSFSREFARMQDEERKAAYRIVDDEGRAYVFDPEEPGWDYDEMASGWDGERWSDDWNA